MSLLPATSHANPTTPFWAVAGSIGPTGPTGPTGPAGVMSISAFYGSPTLNTLITTTGIPGTQIGNTITITTTTTGYIWAMTTANFTSNDNATDHPVSLYMIVDGTTSSPSTDYIVKGTLRTMNCSVNQRTSTTLPAGTYNIRVYAYTDASGVSGNHIRCDHLDVFALGNLL